MTPEQRYLFDVTGYLHIEGALTGADLEKAQAAADQYIYSDPAQYPPGFRTRPRDLTAEQAGNLPLIRYENGFAYDRSLEAMTMSPATWPIIKEFTDNKPRLVSGTLSYQSYFEDQPPFSSPATNPGGLHGGPLHYLNRYQVKDGRIFCNNFICFFYLTDVEPGDGGLIVVPGSHKGEFARPDYLLSSDAEGLDAVKDPVVTNLTPRAGDFLIISELTTHGVLRWRRKDKDRRFLILRYVPQYEGKMSLPEEILERLAPETQELVSAVGYGHQKEIAQQDRITLSA